MGSRRTGAMAGYKDKRDEKTERRAVQKCDPEDTAILLIIMGGITP